VIDILEFYLSHWILSCYILNILKYTYASFMELLQ